MELQARAQIGAGDIDGAISTYERAHEIAPDSLPIFSGYVDLLRSAKKVPEAWMLLQAALDRNPWTPIARADFLFDPTSSNSAISPFPAPYAPVDANLTTSATAMATSTSVDSGTDSFLTGGGGSVDVNVNAASFTIGSISRTPLSATFDPPLASQFRCKKCRRLRVARSNDRRFRRLQERNELDQLCNKQYQWDLGDPK